MADSESPAQPSPAPATSPYADRRKNLALRELIDEMLASIRAATKQELWSAEERAQYERELSTIMSRVRTEAIEPRPAAAKPPAAER